MGKEVGEVGIVENVGGAAGAVGTQQVASAAPDGYTLAVATVSTMIVYGATRASPLYTLDSFAPITNIASMPNGMTVNVNFPAQNLTAFIKVLRAGPGKYTCAS